MGQEWGSVLGCGGGIRDVGKYRHMGEVWGEMRRSVWGECGDCGKVGESVLGCGEVWRSVGKMWGSHTLFYTSPTLLPSPSTSFYTPTPTQQTDKFIFILQLQALKKL